MFAHDTLKHKTILITGGGSGLGLAMAKTFAALGATVVICGRTQEKLTKAHTQITALTSLNQPVLAMACDVRDYDAVTCLFDEAEQTLGKSINGLVNNAAGNFLSASEDLSPNGFKTVVDIVLHGTFNCTHQFGKRLIDKQLSGAVVNIVTTYTEIGCAFVLPSACAKAGVLAMTTSLAYEWGLYNIRLNAIAPGPFPTEGAWSRLVPDPAFEADSKARIPAGRFGNPEELANLAAFLLSDLAEFITGECINIDGGERLQAGMFNYMAQRIPRPELKAIFQTMRPKKN